MQLRFKQCRVCPKNEACNFRDKLRKDVKGIGSGVVAVINCPEYRKLFAENEHVSFEVFDRVIGEKPEREYNQSGEPVTIMRACLVWQLNSTVTGKIVKVTGKFYQIELDSSVTLLRTKS
jgi:hypothetical protein